MKETRNSRWRPWLRRGLVLPAFLAGCLSHNAPVVDKCATITPGAIPQPIGTHTNEILRRQAARAEMDQFVIYLYEWQGDSARLGPFGSRHIDHIVSRLPKVTFPVVIEPDGDSGVNDARRLAVIAYLEQKGIADPGRVVNIGFSQAEGLYSDEAERMFRQMQRPQGNNNNRNNTQGGYGNQNNNSNNFRGFSGQGF